MHDQRDPMKDRLSALLGQVRRAVGRQTDDGLSDEQLLDRFVRDRDEAAFEVLVWRHGSLVLAVGRRQLRSREDAEDVFQATFLALARQAPSIRRGAALAGWLYRVAYRLAVRTRRQRQPRPLDLATLGEAATGPCCRQEQDAAGLLDEELQRLPEKYRIPVVLSYLQERTNQDIATELGIPIGTVFTRLARGRELLRRRLARRGLALSIGIVGTSQADSSAAPLPAGLARATARAARALQDGSAPALFCKPNVMALVQGVEKMTGPYRWLGAMLVLVGVLGSAAGLLAWRSETEQPSGPAAQQAKAGGQETPPQERDRPRVVQVFPADGATDVEPVTEIRIRFDRPMDPSRALLEWDFRSPVGFRPRGEMRYDETTHEFIVPVMLAPGCKHELKANQQIPGEKEERFEGFQSRQHIAARPYGWSFTTKKPAEARGRPPRVSSVSPTSDTEVSLLTLLEVTFDQPMDPRTYGLSFPDASSLDRMPQLLGRPGYDDDQHRFTLMIALPANWNGELHLEGFKSKDGAPAAPMPLKYRTQRSLLSDALRTQIAKAGRSARLCPLIDDVREARRNLRSVSEEALAMTAYGQQHPCWLKTFETRGARFQMQGEGKYLGQIDAIMRMPFRIGSDGTTCWLRRGQERISIPAREVKEQNVRIADPFDAAGSAATDRIIKDMHLEYMGQSKIHGRPCHRLRSWQTSLSSFDSMQPIREWLIDTKTLLPLRVEMMGWGAHWIDYTYSRVNEAIPDEEFRPEAGAGIKVVGPELLTERVSERFLKVIDGSNGRMSVRWGEKGPKGIVGSGLN